MVKNNNGNRVRMTLEEAGIQAIGATMRHRGKDVYGKIDRKGGEAAAEIRSEGGERSHTNRYD